MLECKKCKIEKIESEFRNRKGVKSGKFSWCLECERIYNRSRYIKKEKKEKMKKKPKTTNRERGLKFRYNISLEDYTKMYNLRNGKCDICDLPKQMGGRYGLYVDHDHKTGKIRGLLCTTCNTAIGKLKDNILLLQSAINYLTLNK